VHSCGGSSPLDGFVREMMEPCPLMLVGGTSWWLSRPPFSQGELTNEAGQDALSMLFSDAGIWQPSHSSRSPREQSPRGRSQGEAGSAVGAGGASAAASEDQLARGLENDDGANHCFLNVAIQAFWNLRTFRTRFLNAPEHAHSWEPEVCPVCPSLSSGCVDDVAQTSCARGSSTEDVLQTSTKAVLQEFEKLTPPAVPALVPRSPVAEADEAIRGFKGGAADDTCCYCALKSLFTHYRYTEQETLPPDSLRKALSHIYTSQGRFQLGEMEDATETIEVLLDVLHASSVSAFEAEALEFAATSPGASSSADPMPGGSSPEIGRRKSDAELVNEASNFPCQPLCIAHEVFGIEYVDIPRCTFCGFTGEPSVTGSFLLAVYVADLLELQEKVEQQPLNPAAEWDLSTLWSADKWGGSRPDLHNLLWRTHQHSTPRARCKECSSLRTMVFERWLTHRPYTLILSLVWPDSRPSRENLWWVLSSIQPVLSADRVFQYQSRVPSEAASKGGLPPPPPARDPKDFVLEEDFVFCGMICYCGNHIHNQRRHLAPLST